MKQKSLKPEIGAPDFLGKMARLSMVVAAVVVALLPFSTYSQQQEIRNCATMQVHERLLETDPDYRGNRLKIEEFTTEYIKNLKEGGAAALRSGVVRIPVVVHVVWNTAAQNVSDAQIQSQIDVLNEDYRRVNADWTTAPAAFQPLAADARIEFALAVRDPDCNPTTGITRTSTTVTSFPADDTVKSAATGGHDAWPRDKYLNLWVCNLPYIPGLGNLMGYAQFPGGPAATDGVVIDYAFFGTMGTVSAPFDLGRTATHEIGHWFNLIHIWGDDDSACTGSDSVADTPNQGGPNVGCPTFPRVTCSNGPNGDMFMNFMDYVNDDCMVMFSQGQADRMNACLLGARAAILASDGLIPPPAVPPATDLWSQDKPDDMGDEPNTISSPMYQSDDIWVRLTNDGLTNQEHQNPQYRPAGPSNYVYVRIRNRGCGGSGTGTVRLYWAKASTALGWPAPWDGSIAVPALMGGSIGSQSTGSVPGGGFVILEFAWNPPNPADYASFGADQAHFCLLSRIETSPTAPYGMTFAEGANLHTNVRNNNNIVWKNVTVVTGSGRFGCVVVGNITKEIVLTKFVFDIPTGEEDLFKWGRIFVDLGGRLFRKWRDGDTQGWGIEIISEGVIQVTRPGAWIGGIKFDGREFHTVRVEFVPFERPPTRTNIFELLLTQYALDKEVLVVGGQRFILKDKFSPTFTGLVMQPPALGLTWQRFGTGSYTVEFTDDLFYGKWEPLPGFNWPTTELSWYEKDISGLRKGFYRVRSQ